MFKVALKIFEGNSERVNRVRACFGEYLEQRGYQEEAGFMFLQADVLSSALSSFKAALNVPMVQLVARKE